ncbi:MAG: hypothetical protein AB1611_09090 [bacterium]
MSREVMELFDIFSGTFGKEKAQVIVRDIETLVNDHKRELAGKEDIQKIDTRLSEVELKLTKEIEQVRGEIKEVELKLTREIEQVRGEIKELELKLTREIEQIRGEIKEVELKLTREIEQVRSSVIKWVVGWVAGLLIAQTGTIIAIFTLFHR